jgi:cytochrome c553
MKSRISFRVPKLALLLTLALSPVATLQAQERLFKNADSAAGKTLHTENNCSTCHQQRTGKDEKDFYTRLDRKVQTQEKLISQIAYCSAQLSLSFFPEDELNIAAFLNSAYYKLK